MVGQRVAPIAQASSGFDRIVILATSNAPRPSPVTPAVSRPPGPQPLRRLPQPASELEDEPDEADEPNVAATPRPETPADLRRRLGQLLEADADDDDNDDEPAPAPSTPTNPFGVTTGAARPGVITPVPARPQPRQAPDPATQP
jgi:hypothetical protein